MFYQYLSPKNLLIHFKLKALVNKLDIETQQILLNT